MKVQNPTVAQQPQQGAQPTQPSQPAQPAQPGQPQSDGQDQADPKIMQAIEQHMNSLPDEQKQFIGAFLTPEFSLAMGIILGKEAYQYFNSLADPKMALLPIPRDQLEQMQSQHQSDGMQLQNPGAQQQPQGRPAMPQAQGQPSQPMTTMR